MLMRGCPCGIALIAWSTVACAGNSIFAGSAGGATVCAASAGAGLSGDTGLSAGDVSLLASAVAGVSGGGADALLPPHAANANSSGRASAPIFIEREGAARNGLETDRG